MKRQLMRVPILVPEDEIREKFLLEILKKLNGLIQLQGPLTRLGGMENDTDNEIRCFLDAAEEITSDVYVALEQAEQYIRILRDFINMQGEETRVDGGVESLDASPEELE
jgi:hypothetical protein